MAAAETTLVRCGVVVEVNGKPLTPDKAVGKARGPQLGLELARPCRAAPVLRVLGFKREIRLTASDVRQVVSNHLAEGRMAIVTKTGMKVMIAKAQSTQLELALQYLSPQADVSKANARGGSMKGHEKVRTNANADSAPRMVATPAKLQRTEPVPSANDAVQSTGKVDVLARRASLCDLAPPTIEELLLWNPCASTHRRLSETCRRFNFDIIERQKTFQLGGGSCRVGIKPESLITRVAKHVQLQVLDLAGFAELNAKSTPCLADVLKGFNGQLQKLSLRGCKALTDVAVQRILTSVPLLRVLDLLEIPRLSNRALEVRLPQLEILVVGQLARALVSGRDRPSPNASAIAVGEAPPLSQKSKTIGSTLFSHTLLARFAQPSSASDQEGVGGSPITHAVFAHCSDILVMPRLPKTLQHLDLRGASLQIPLAAVPTWKPLASCPHLVVLCLEGIMTLSSAALQACVCSLPSCTELKVLDISDTRADEIVFGELSKRFVGLTHVRTAGCKGMHNGTLGNLLGSLRELEVLDVARCSALEAPFADVPIPVTHGPGGIAIPARAEKLRRLGIGQTNFALSLESTRRSLAVIAPIAQATNGSLDIFGSYAALPPALM